jgi:transcriptional regulator with XRE-family HTH domain
MKEVGQRLRSLREGVKLSQAKIGEMVGTTQASINRYETGVGFPPPKVLLWYADYFDVSMDYIFARTGKPQGTLYEYKPKIIENDAEMRKFVEMCFDPQSPMNDRLKQTLIEMLGEAKK